METGFSEQAASSLSGIATPTRILMECGNWEYPPPATVADPLVSAGSSPLTPSSPVASQFSNNNNNSHPAPVQQAAPYPMFFFNPYTMQQRPPTPPPTTVYPCAKVVESSSFCPVEPSPPKPVHPATRKRRSTDTAEDEEDDDQRKKLLERNRVAASKCRQKKKKWTQDLESRAEQMTSRNKELRTLLSQLREESMFLRNQLLAHGNCDCSMVQTYLRRSSAQLTSSCGMANHAAAAADAVADLFKSQEQQASSSPSPECSVKVCADAKDS